MKKTLLLLFVLCASLSAQVRYYPGMYVFRTPVVWQDSTTAGYTPLHFYITGDSTFLSLYRVITSAGNFSIDLRARDRTGGWSETVYAAISAQNQANDSTFARVQATANGGVYALGRRRSGGAYNTFFKAFNDSFVVYINGTQYLKVQSNGSTIGAGTLGTSSSLWPGFWNTYAATRDSVIVGGQTSPVTLGKFGLTHDDDGATTVLRTYLVAQNGGTANTTVTVPNRTATMALMDALNSGAFGISGNLAVNGGSVTSTSTTFNLLNSTVTTLNIGGAAVITMGRSSDSAAAQTVYGSFRARSGFGGAGHIFSAYTTPMSLTFNGASGDRVGLSMNSAASSSPTNGLRIDWNLNDGGGTLRNAALFRVLSDDTTSGAMTASATIGLMQAGTNIGRWRFGFLNTDRPWFTVGTALGVATGNMRVDTLVAENLVSSVDGSYSGDVAVNGGDLTSSAATFNLLNATTTQVNIGGAASITAGRSSDSAAVNFFRGTFTARSGVGGGDHKFSRSTASATTQVARFESWHNGGTAADNDGGFLTFNNSPDGGSTSQELGRITWTKVGASNTGRVRFSVEDEGTATVKQVIDTVGVTFGATSGTGTVSVFAGAYYTGSTLGYITSAYGAKTASGLYVAASSGGAVTTQLNYANLTINGTTYKVLVADP